MSNISIKAENLSKAYQLGEFSTGTLSRDIERWWYLLRGKEDPFLKIGETNDRTKTGGSDIVWSLKDVNFEINQGDAVGIIGKNGAGKSTLLKVLSRVTTPTTGSIKVKGRIASLLEVGTGFHPELTGRENIFLNGAILGMRKFEIKKHFDAIVDFAGVERYIDTPVKRYSSGMYVRLAFAVAAHLESEILIVDEVLAVGDAEFQKKCLGKMGEVSKGQGRTVLFVSHNMNAVLTLCNKGILLKNGTIDMVGTSAECVSGYITMDRKTDFATTWINEGKKFSDPHFSITKAALLNKDLDPLQSGIVNNDDDLLLLLEGNVSEVNSALKVGYRLYDEDENLIFTSHFTDTVPDEWPVLDEGVNRLLTKIPVHMLKPGNYSVSINVELHWQKNVVHAQLHQIVLNFEVINTNIKTPYWDQNCGFVHVPVEYKKIN